MFKKYFRTNILYLLITTIIYCYLGNSVFAALENCHSGFSSLTKSKPSAAEYLSKITDQSIKSFFAQAQIYGITADQLMASYTAKIYKLRFERGDPGLHLLVEKMGWKLEDGRFIPPSGEEFFMRFYQMLSRKVENLGLPETDLILPAIVLSRNLPNGERAIHFYRIGLDSLPPRSEGWTWTEELAIPSYKFRSMIANGAMVIDKNRIMSTHDFGHLLDILLHPEVAGGDRRLQVAKSKRKTDVFLAHISVQWDRSDASIFFHIIQKIDEVVNEFLYFPPLENHKKILALFGSPEIQTDFHKIHNRLKLLPEEKLIDQAKKLTQAQYLFLENYGGGSRDNSIYEFLSPNNFYEYRTSFTELLEEKGHPFFLIQSLEVMEIG